MEILFAPWVPPFLLLLGIFLLLKTKGMGLRIAAPSTKTLDNLCLK